MYVQRGPCGAFRIENGRGDLAGSCAARIDAVSKGCSGSVFRYQTDASVSSWGRDAPAKQNRAQHAGKPFGDFRKQNHSVLPNETNPGGEMISENGVKKKLPLATGAEHPAYQSNEIRCPGGKRLRAYPSPFAVGNLKHLESRQSPRHRQLSLRPA